MEKKQKALAKYQKFISLAESHRACSNDQRIDRSMVDTIKNYLCAAATARTEKLGRKLVVHAATPAFEVCIELGHYNKKIGNPQRALDLYLRAERITYDHNLSKLKREEARSNHLKTLLETCTRAGEC